MKKVYTMVHTFTFTKGKNINPKFKGGKEIKL